jgi:LysR family transcriptional regulator of gallate degradation
MYKELPNIRHLRAFIAVASCKSISKATKTVFLSQPAITQAIAKLEANFESTFFNRKTDGMYLTDSGELLAKRVDRALGLILDGLKEVLRFHERKTTAHAEQVLNLLTTTQLRALIAVVTHRNFSLAGRQLGVSQSSVHRSSRDLESMLEIPLFEKTSTGISPTKAALMITRASKLAFSELEQAKEEIYSLNNKEIGHLRVGSMPLARTSILPSTIIDFGEVYPEFKLSIIDGPYVDLLNHLRHGEVDVLIGALRYPAPVDDILQEELFSSEVVLLARSGHPLLSKNEITLDDLQKSSWVLPQVATPTRSIFDALFKDNEIQPPERIVESSSQLVIRSLLEGSDRLTVISAHQLQRELNEGVLCVLPFKLDHAVRPIGITTRRGWLPTQKQHYFLDRLRTRAGELISDTL